MSDTTIAISSEDLFLIKRFCAFNNLLSKNFLKQLIDESPKLQEFKAKLQRMRFSDKA